MDDVEKQNKIKLFKAIGIIFVILLLGEEWIITQLVADECEYNPVLDWYIAINETYIYFPLDYYRWCNNELIYSAIPDILNSYSNYRFLVVMVTGVLMFTLSKGINNKTTHGSASFASYEDINDADLGQYISKNGGNYEYKKIPIKLFGITLYHQKEKILKDSGVVVGINPYTGKLMLHDGVEHMLLMAPTRSGKGVCTIIPTGLIWKHSIFFFDPKGELWSLTSGYRKKYLKQKVMKFQPLCIDGSSARWNPLAEVNYRTNEELSDVSTIVSIMVRPDGEQKGGDSFWPDSAAALLNGVILHLLYKHDKENRPLPCPTDIMSFLSSPDMDTNELFSTMRDYPHISPKEFLEEEILDDKGNKIIDPLTNKPKHIKNPLKEIYGEYIKEFKPFSDALGIVVCSMDEIRIAIKHKISQGETIKWETIDDETGLPIDAPYHMLLTHPKVAECAANMLNGAEQTRASIMQTAQTSLAVYQDPVVQRNTSVSDFAIRDLLDPRQEVSLYLVMEVKDIQTIRPIARLFVQMMCSKLIRDMKFDTDVNKVAKKKQRLLLMLDEFPQLGNMKCIELALAICAGYGIKMCIVCQDVNQINKEYTKDNSINSNCHVHIYFTPNIDSGGATAEAISKMLGKKTIDTTSHSSGKGLFDGSVSTSQTGRELMTPDEISHMSSEKELVFVAGHKAIFGNKLRYYEHSWLLNRTKLGHPVTSDSVTEVKSYKELFAVHAADAEEKEKEKITVLHDKAQKLGLTYEDYINKLNKERENREKEIIARITGGTIESPKTNSDEKCRKDSESKKGEEATRNEQERKSSPPLNIRKSVEQEFNDYKNQKRMKANADFKQQDIFDVLNEEKNE